MFPSENSSKLDKSLMDAYLEIHEGVRKGHAAGDTDIAKQASQLASDVKYKAKGKVKPGANKEEIKKVYMALLSASPAPAPVKVLAKKKLLGEAVEPDGGGSAPQMPTSVVKFVDELPEKIKGAAKKVKKVVTGESVKPEFTGQSGYDKAQRHVDEYLKNTPEGKKGQENKKRVKKDMEEMGIGESAMPERDHKPTKEPSKPNVEKKPRPSVKLEGLDPVGQEDKDVDNDGDHDKSDKYLLKRRGAIKKAIQKRRMKEGFSDWRQDISFNEESKK